MHSSFYYNHYSDPDWGYIDDNDAAHGYVEEALEKYSKKKKCECGLEAAIKAGAAGGKHAPYCPKFVHKRRS